MPKPYQATSTNVEDYWQLFVNRRAYVLQSMRPHAESGRYYYFRPKAGKNGEAPSLAAETGRRHQKGEAALKQSRRGAHLWIFGAQPLLDRQCRLLISGLALKLGIPIKGA